ncbi:putative Transcription factor [Quillaja saponaria]|uniref:Transcription factor n=1 Tax=Quillaja saponaria TaxID=32244 RepID=A0AAD7LYX6_QUISA|nr:putative Transcription factor [Quillaja saponaria]KAJ7966789.1 putative Transcription factor [Quillaja saponaria]
MESANLHHQHHHHLQDHDQLDVVGTSSLSTSPSCHGVGISNAHVWTPNMITLNNAGNFNSNFLNSRISTHKDDSQVPRLDNTMIQDLGSSYQLWSSASNTSSSNGGSCLTSQSSTHHDHHLHLSKIKEENSSDAFPKFTEMLNTTTSPSRLDHDQHKDLNVEYLSEKLLLKTLSTGEFYSNAHQNYHSLIGGTVQGVPSRGSFSQIYPSINISNLNNHQSSSSPISSSLDMNLQAMDLLTSSRFTQSSHDHVLRLDHMHHPINDRSSCSPSNISPHFTNIGVIADQAKRTKSLMESKACRKSQSQSQSQSQSAPKKPRLESRTPCPPIKVRKEKLGDRIAALQQLVAPFGKTDTASVLMEAIGYIKFLQSQVETLSVPYMKSSRNQANKVMQGSSTTEDGNLESKRDLRSQGLCLVPLSSMSYVTGNDSGGGVWPPPNFAGGT